MHDCTSPQSDGLLGFSWGLVHLAEVISTMTVSDATRNAVAHPPQVFASHSKCFFGGVGAGKWVPDLLALLPENWIILS